MKTPRWQVVVEMQTLGVQTSVPAYVCGWPGKDTKYQADGLIADLRT